MKIRIYILALDASNVGTSATWYYTESSLYRNLIEQIVGEDEKAHALKLLESDNEALMDLLYAEAEGRCATWEIQHADVDVETAEKIQPK